jgi:hypothetical protein
MAAVNVSLGKQIRVLRSVFGFDGFLADQEEVIKSVNEVTSISPRVFKSVFN